MWALTLAGALGLVGYVIPGAQSALWRVTASGLATSLAVLCAPVVYVSAALGQRLPKRALLPLCWTVAWSLAGAMPVPIYAGLDGTGPWVAAVFLVAGTAALVWSQLRVGAPGITRAWLAERGPRISGRHLARFVAAHAVLVPVALGAYVAGSTALALPVLSDGYVRLRPDGLYVLERTLVRDDRRVKLLGTVHIGEPDFYAGIEDALRLGEPIVLREGVTDREGRIRGLDYGGLADALGLAEQQGTLSLGDRATAPGRAVLGVPYSDIDASEMSEETVSVLAAVADLYSERSAAALVRYLTLSLDPHVLDHVWADIVTRRNDRVLASLDAAVDRSSSVAIPWGALHMPGIEEGLRARGFTPAEEQLHLAVRFGAARATDVASAPPGVTPAPAVPPAAARSVPPPSDGPGR